MDPTAKSPVQPVHACWAVEVVALTTGPLHTPLHLRPQPLASSTPIVGKSPLLFSRTCLPVLLFEIRILHRLWGWRTVSNWEMETQGDVLQLEGGVALYLMCVFRMWDGRDFGDDTLVPAIVNEIKRERLDSLLTDVAVPQVMERAKGYGRSYKSIVDFQMGSKTLQEFLGGRKKRDLGGVKGSEETEDTGSEEKKTIVAYVVAHWDMGNRMLLLETMYDRRATRTGETPLHIWLWALRHRHDSVGQALNGNPSRAVGDETATDATDFSLRRLGFRPLNEHVEMCGRDAKGWELDPSFLLSLSPVSLSRSCWASRYRLRKEINI
ncbi:hypothetical protein BC829DRAFT_432857 [Chytridium lagenaria]|nr:hypothetical protein BC829DRAFT_432857 [Chytridium lagenaria]